MSDVEKNSFKKIRKSEMRSIEAFEEDFEHLETFKNKLRDMDAKIVDIKKTYHLLCAICSV